MFMCAWSLPIDTIWLKQVSILLIHRSYHVVGVICGLYLTISNYNEGSISAALSGPDSFLPEESAGRRSDQSYMYLLHNFQI